MFRVDRARNFKSLAQLLPELYSTLSYKQDLLWLLFFFSDLLNNLILGKYNSICVYIFKYKMTSQVFMIICYMLYVSFLNNYKLKLSNNEIIFLSYFYRYFYFFSLRPMAFRFF